MTHHATTVAVDLSMTVFEIGIADRQWRVGERRRLNRRQFARFLADQPVSHIVMEACGTAHHWGRVAQSRGHRVTLLPVRYVKPYSAWQQDRPHGRRRAARCGAHGTDSPGDGEDGRATGNRRLASHSRTMDGDADGSHQCPPWFLPRTRHPARRWRARGAHRGTDLGRAVAGTTRARGHQRLRRRAGARSAHRRDRATARRPGQGRHDGPASPGDSRDWAADRDRPRRLRRPHHRVSSRPPVCELAGPDTARTLERAATPARLDHETGRCVSALSAHTWGARRLVGGAAPRGGATTAHWPPAVGRTTRGEKGPQQNDDRRRQQTRANRLGRVGA